MAVSSEIVRDQLLTRLRSAGLPVKGVEVDMMAAMIHEPDLTAEDHSWSCIFGHYKESKRQREFWSPVVRWELDDGRRFRGRPELATTREEWASLLAGGSRTRLDDRECFRNLVSLIHQSE